MNLLRQAILELSAKTKKVYEVDLVEVSSGKYLVNFRYGRVGKRLQESTKTVAPVNGRKALAIYDDLVSSKVAKGYVVISDSGPGIPQLQNVTQAAPATTPKPQTAQAKSEREAAVLKKIASPNDTERALGLWRAGEMQLASAIDLALQNAGPGKTKRNVPFSEVQYAALWAISQIGPKLDPQAPSLAAARDVLQQSIKLDHGESVALIAQLGLLQIEDAHFPDQAEKTRANIASELPQAFVPFGEKTPDEAALDAAIKELKARQKEKPDGRSRWELQNMRYNHQYPKARGKLASLGETIVRLYVINRPHAKAHLLDAVRVLPARYPLLRMFRRLLKLAELRRDPEMFGVLSRRLRKARSYEDGFSAGSRVYLNRRTWRSLRRLGEIDSPDYVKMAVGVLAALKPKDAHEPRVVSNFSSQGLVQRRPQTPGFLAQLRNRFLGRPASTASAASAAPTQSNLRYYGPWARYMTLNQILFRHSRRYRPSLSGRVFEFDDSAPAPTEREEAFSHLWDADPQSLTDVLLKARIEVAHAFAVRALQDHRAHTMTWSNSTLASVLRAPFEETAQLGLSVAQARYNPSAPDSELLVAVANSSLAAAQTQAETWIRAAAETLKDDVNLWRWLLLSPNESMRRLAKTEMQRVLPSSATKEQVLIGVIAEMIAPDQKDDGLVADVAEILLSSFSDVLRHLDFEVVHDLAEHPLLANPLFAIRILEAHARFKDEAPEATLAALLHSQHAPVRQKAVELLGSLSDRLLLDRAPLIASLVAHSDPGIRTAARPIAGRLAQLSDSFAGSVVSTLVAQLLRPKQDDELQADLSKLLLGELSPWLKLVDQEAVFKLLRAESKAAHDVAGVLLREMDGGRFEMTAIVELANNEVLSVRQTAWKFLSEDKARAERELVAAVRMLDSDWADSRQFAETFLRDQISQDKFTPDVLVSVMDSNRHEVQQYGQALITRSFKTADGPLYLSRLAEHPSPLVQTFVSALVLEHVGTDLERFKNLGPYFRCVVSRVNQGAVAKARVFQFFATVLPYSVEHAAFVASILDESSVTMAIDDKATAIRLLADIQRRYPELQTKLRVIKPEVRRAV